LALLAFSLLAVTAAAGLAPDHGAVDAPQSERTSGESGGQEGHYLGHIGCSVRDSDVVFTFERALYERATRGDTGETVPLSSASFDESSDVAVAGEFNDWSRSAWKMTPLKSGVYSLTVPLSKFEGRDSWLFKFVIDGIYWVEPPANASNAVPTGFGNNSFNLVLQLTEPEQNMAGHLQREPAACSTSPGKAGTSTGRPSQEPVYDLAESPLLERLSLPDSEMREGWRFKPIDSAVGAAPIPLVANPMITSDERVIAFVSVFVMPPTPEEEARWEEEMAGVAPEAMEQRIADMMAERTRIAGAAYVGVYETSAGGPETGVFALEFNEPLSKERRDELRVSGPGGAVIAGEWAAAAVWTDDRDSSCLEVVQAHVESVLGE
jgi:hypothetical protein